MPERAAPSTVAAVFERRTVRQHRNRAALNFSAHDFLLQWTGDQLLDRLRDVKRDFPLALQIGARGPAVKTGSVIVMDMAENFLRGHQCAIQGDEEFLPLRAHSIDMAFSNLSLHTVNDLPGALIQIRRALKPDGLFIAALMGGETLRELRHCLMQAEIRVLGGISPRVAPFADKPQMGSLLQRAGFALPVVDSEIVTVTYDTIFKLMHDLRGMGETNSITERTRTFMPRRLLAEAERIYRDNFADDDGRLRATFEIIFLIGWAPHESQQQPLRPGSAEKRLADVLNTTEIKS